MGYLIVILGSYLLGSINMAYILAKFKGADLRKAGSGNLGASNATTLLGWKIGIAVALHDIAKGTIAVLLAKHFFPGLPNIGAIAGISAVMGHIFPFYLRFKGGKGFASYVGMTIALNWKLAIAAILLALVVTLVTDYIALATLTTVCVVPGYLIYSQPSILLILLLLVSTAIIFHKHRDNIKRMLSGSEIGLRSTMRGENRIK